MSIFNFVPSTTNFLFEKVPMGRSSSKGICLELSLNSKSSNWAAQMGESLIAQN